MFKVSPTSLQTFIDTPNCVLEDFIQYSTVHIPNVFCDGHLQLISCVLYCNYQVDRDFLITLYHTVWCYIPEYYCKTIICTRVGTLIVATIYLQLIQNRYMFRSFTVLQ